MPNVILKLNGTKIDSLEALRENFNPEEIQNAMRGVPKLQTWLREHDLDDLADQLEHVKIYVNLPEIARKLQLPDDKIKELEQGEPEEIKLLRKENEQLQKEIARLQKEIAFNPQTNPNELYMFWDDFMHTHGENPDLLTKYSSLSAEHQADVRTTCFECLSSQDFSIEKFKDLSNIKSLNTSPSIIRTKLKALYSKIIESQK